VGVVTEKERMNQALQVLSPYRRMDRYRGYAATALERAGNAECDAAKAALLDIAARWDDLAQDIQRRLDLSRK
jgi:hypothetical protein